MLRALDPGLHATLQDLGRPGHAALGVARSGAADALALVVANRLAGNPDGAAALELTLTGGAWRAETGLTVALAGAAMPAVLEHADGRREPLAWHAAHALPGGGVLRLGATRVGARAYLAVAGGLAVEPVLGSASTHVAASLGGYQGRALRAGDVLATGARAGARAPRALDSEAAEEIQGWLRAPRLRATDGSHSARFAPETRAAFWNAEFSVSAQADRMGVRLEGPVPAPPDGGRLVTQGLPVGAVEIPGAGQAIVLLSDAPPTGGYAVVACVAAVDLPRLGQLRPHERVRFERIDLAAARTAWVRRQERLATLLPPA